MKYFFIRKPKYNQGKDVDHGSIANVYLINDEKILKRVINTGEINKFRKIIPFREGDLVQLTSKPSIEWNYYMQREFLGKTVVLTRVTSSYIQFVGDEGYCFRSCNVEHVLSN